MKDISGKVSYLQGLSEGLNINDGTPQGKMISGILSVLDEMADSIIDIQSDMGDFKEYIESIDDDLFDLEEEVRSKEDKVLELSCSNCGEELCVDSDEDEDSMQIVCPECNEVVFINDGSFDYDAYIGEDDIQEKHNHSHS